jgi:tetratricopeptide (TPR) repeat protein
MLRAAELYRKALALDPAFALAWLGLAEASRGIFVFAPAYAVEAGRALDEAAQRAMQIAPDFWASHLAESWRLSLKRDWLGYEQALDRARQLAHGTPPELSLARAVCLSQSGRMHAAAVPARLAVRDDPLSLLPSNILQMILHAAGRDEESEAEYLRSLDLPGARDTAEHTALQRAWYREDETLIEQRFVRYLQTRTMSLPAFDRVFEVRKQRDEVLKILRAAVSDSPMQAPVPQMLLAWWLARYGDDSAALAAASRAQLDFTGAFCNWLWFPVLASLRRTSGFKELLTRLDLPPFWRTIGDWGDFARPVGQGMFECL